jgi:hypothetical protein
MIATSPSDVETQVGPLLGSIDRLGLYLESLRDGGYITRVLNDFIATRGRSALVGRDDVGEDVIVLIRNAQFTMHVRTHRRPNPTIHSVSAAFVSVLLGEAPITVTRYRPARKIDYDIFEPGVELIEEAQRPYDGRFVAADPAVHTISEWHSPEPFLELRLALGSTVSQIWHFDRATRCSIFASLSNMKLTGLVTLARTFAALDDHRSLPFLKNLTSHESHIVRWTAIQSIGKLDRAEALVCLEAAASDSHPHIRTSAAKILHRTGGGGP